MVYPKGIFLSDAFLFLLFAMFKYSRFPDEKTHVPVSSDLDIKAYLCFIDIGHFSWDGHKLPTGTGFHMNTSGHTITIIWENHVRVHSSPSKINFFNV